jgi:hypothetical protein
MKKIFLQFILLISLFNLAFAQTNIYDSIFVGGRWRVKYFKYIGNDTVTIKSTWTGDPHFINSYPSEPLVKGKIYSFTISFFFAGMNRYFEKAMGFELSNGQRICYYFKGNIQKQDTNENH